jgi:hypothetical protein
LSIGRKGLYLKRSLLKKNSIGAYVKFCAAVIAHFTKFTFLYGVKTKMGTMTGQSLATIVGSMGKC